jgi:hypothetical protein
MRIALASVFCPFLSLLSVCCVVSGGGGGVPVEREEIGEVVEVQPAPVERVYVYEAGYPPGTYLYDGYYYYGRHRYERNVFITKVVNVNIQKNRYVNVTENRRTGQQIEQKHRTEYTKNGGRTTGTGTTPPGSTTHGDPIGKNPHPPKKSAPKDTKDAKDPNKA